MERRASSRPPKQNSRFSALPGEGEAEGRRRQKRKAADLKTEDAGSSGSGGSSSGDEKAADVKQQRAAIREAASLVDRLTDAVMEAHFSRDASLRQVARKFAINTKTLSKYHQAVQDVLQAASPKDRSKVYEAVLAHNRSFRANLGVHQRRFTPFQELLILGVLWLFEDVSIPMTKQQIMFIIRNTMQERAVRAFGAEMLEEPDNMDSWYNSFSRRHEEDLKLRRAFSKKDSVDVAGGVVSVRRWFEKLSRIEQKLIEDNLLPPTGLQPFQMINYSEMPVNPPNRQAQVDERNGAEENKGADASGDGAVKYPIQYGLLTTGEGKTLAGHLYHKQPDATFSDAMIAQFALPANGTEGPRAELDKPISEYEAINQRRRKQPHWFLSHSLPDRKPEDDIGSFVAQLIEAIDAYRDEDPRCNADTVFILTLESHHAVVFDEIEAIKLLTALMDHKVFVVFIPIHLSLIVQPNNRGFYHYFNEVFAQVLQADAQSSASGAGAGAGQGGPANAKKRRQEDTTSTTAAGSRRTLKSVFTTALAIVSDSNQAKSILRSGMMEAGLAPNHGAPGFLPMTRPPWYIGNPLQMLDLEEGGLSIGRAMEDGAQQSAGGSAAASSSAAAGATASSSGGAALASTGAPAVAVDPLQARVQAQIEAFRHAVKEAEEHLMRQRARILTEAQGALNKVQLEFRDTLRNLSSSSADQIPGGVEALFTSMTPTGDDRQDQDTKRRRLAKHKKLPAFDLFCSERGVEIDDANEDDLMRMSDEFVRLSKQQKQQLEQRLATQIAAYRGSPDEERMARLCRRASFKAFVAEATQQLPTALPRPQLEGFATIFNRLNAATKARLMYRWRDNPLNVRPINRVRKSSSGAGASSSSSSSGKAADLSAVNMLAAPSSSLEEAGV